MIIKSIKACIKYYHLIQLANQVMNEFKREINTYLQTKPSGTFFNQNNRGFPHQTGDFFSYIFFSNNSKYQQQKVQQSYLNRFPQQKSISLSVKNDLKQKVEQNKNYKYHQNVQFDKKQLPKVEQKQPAKQNQQQNTKNRKNNCLQQHSSIYNLKIIQNTQNEEDNMLLTIKECKLLLGINYQQQFQIKIEPKLNYFFEKVEQITFWKVEQSRIPNNCYMNSVLQCLHKTYELKQELQNSEISVNKSPLKDYYLQLCEKMDLSILSTSHITLIKDLISKDNFIFEGFHQQDASEWLICFLKQVQEQMKIKQKQTKIKIKIDPKQRLTIDQQNVDQLYQKSKQKDQGLCKSIIDDIFTGRWKTVYQCMTCNFNYVLFQKFQTLYLNIPSHLSNPKLTDCFQEFSRKQRLIDQNMIHCYHCKSQQITEKQMTVYETNKILIICLRRSLQEDEEAKDVQIPFQLNQTILKYVKKPSSQFTYKLYGMINHVGTQRGGHYTANCLYYGNWYHHNDQKCRRIDENEAKQSAKRAYTFFYRLQDHPIKRNIIQIKSLKSYQYKLNKSISKEKPEKINLKSHSQKSTDEDESIQTG